LCGIHPFPLPHGRGRRKGKKGFKHAFCFWITTTTTTTITTITHNSSRFFCWKRGDLLTQKNLSFKLIKLSLFFVVDQVIPVVDQVIPVFWPEKISVSTHSFCFWTPKWEEESQTKILKKLRLHLGNGNEKLRNSSIYGHIQLNTLPRATHTKTKKKERCALLGNVNGNKNIN